VPEQLAEFQTRRAQYNEKISAIMANEQPKNRDEDLMAPPRKPQYDDNQ